MSILPFKCQKKNSSSVKYYYRCLLIKDDQQNCEMGFGRALLSKQEDTTVRIRTSGANEDTDIATVEACAHLPTAV